MAKTFILKGKIMKLVKEDAGEAHEYIGLWDDHLVKTSRTEEMTTKLKKGCISCLLWCGDTVISQLQFCV